MTDKPTRSQLMDLLAYVAGFTGSAYEDDAEVKLRLYEMDGPTDSPSKKVATVPERALAQHREAWVRDNWETLIDHYVDDGFADDDSPYEDVPCPRDQAHGAHWWDYSQFPDHIFEIDPSRPEVKIEHHCPGIKAHRNTAIGGANDGKPAMYGQPDLSTVFGGGDDA